VGESDHAGGKRPPSPERAEFWAPLDDALLAGVRRRDARALGLFFDHVFPFVYSLATRLTRDRTAAEDVTQEVFLKVHRAADKLLPERSPYPWLSTITVNTCRDLSRSRSRRMETPLDGETAAGIRDPAPGADDTVLLAEQSRLLDRALASLARRQREIVLLHDYCGWTHEEIAGLVGASPVAVRKRYSRALDAMRDRVRELSA
jgi:RNA polymerase sigma-70 factor (ECF subfamily)